MDPSTLSWIDRFLMDDFCDYGIPCNQLEKLNAYHMHLQVMTLAEITNHMGTMLLPQVLLGPMNHAPKGLTSISMSLLKWPTIHLPTSPCWKLWSRTIHTLYSESSTGMQLCWKLGPWKPAYSQYHFWHWRLANPTSSFAIHLQQA